MATPSLNSGTKWMEALADAIAGEAEEVPEGWNTIDEVAESIKLSTSWTYKQLEQLVKQGGAEKQKFRIKTGSQVRPIFHYRIIASED